ncbi:MAG: ABC transporter substrate-binding protein [Candidatus Omnitrophica bacterium]|nr:ABC transporter substrate-binding protein [Candidatus Omnitrophota bacterium]
MPRCFFQKPVNNSKALKFLIIFLLLCVLSCGKQSIADDSKERSLQHITLRIDWFPSVLYAPFILAQQKGYYKAEGLTVEIIHAKGSSMAVQGLANKENDFGIIHAISVLTARAKNIPLVSLATLFQTNPYGIFYLKEKNIVKPSDLIGKRVICNLPRWPNYKNLGYEQFKIFLKKNGLNIDQTIHVQCAHLAEVSALLDGEGDVCIGVAFGFQNKLKKRGVEFNAILFRDYGINPYYYAIVTHEDTAKENPTLCKKFIRATIKGWEYAIVHPEEAVNAYVNLFYSKREHKEDILKTFIDMTLNCKNETTEKYGFGYQTREGWENVQDHLTEAGLIDRKIKLDEVYTNDFLP